MTTGKVIAFLLSVFLVGPGDGGGVLPDGAGVGGLEVTVEMVTLDAGTGLHAFAWPVGSGGQEIPVWVAGSWALVDPDSGGGIPVPLVALDTLLPGASEAATAGTTGCWLVPANSPGLTPTYLKLGPVPTVGEGPSLSAAVGAFQQAYAAKLAAGWLPTDC